MDVPALRELIETAQGQRPADLVLRGGKVVNVFSGEIEEVAVAVHGGRIAGLRAEPGAYADANETIDLDGRYLAPSFIDAHIHLESSQLWVGEFARVVVPHGTGAVVTDPHEIANVLGLDGVRALMEAARDLPLTARFVIPSCVPASSRETSGAILDAATIEPALDWPGIAGLGEMMNFPGVLGGDGDVLATLAAVSAWPSICSG